MMSVPLLHALFVNNGITFRMYDPGKLSPLCVTRIFTVCPVVIPSDRNASRCSPASPSHPMKSSLHITWFSTVPGHPEWIESTLSIPWSMPPRSLVPQVETVRNTSPGAVYVYHTSAVPNACPQSDDPSGVAPTSV